MSLKHRAVRLGAALALAVMIGAQIPSNSGTALARDDYPEAGSSGGGDAVRIAAAGATILGVASVISGGTGAGAAGAAAGGVIAAGTSGVTGAALVPALVNSKPIWDVSNTTDELNQFAKLSESAGYKDQLRKDGQFTAFIPTNGAFDKVDRATLASLTDPANQAKLGDLVASHVIIGKKTIEDLKREATNAGVDGVQYDTINGRKLTVTYDANQILRVNGVIVRETDLPASNGVIHPILDVINPDTSGAAAPAAAPVVVPAAPAPAPAPAAP